MQARAYFPYSIRSGDTLGSVAELFGVPLAELMRINHLNEESQLVIGQNIRIPNPFLARERELTSEIDRLTLEQQTADQRLRNAESAKTALRSQVQDLTASNEQNGHDARMLPWWRWAAVTASAAALLMLGTMFVALVEWWVLRSRFRAVAEMNDSLRRLDTKYRWALAKAELRLQEIYGRRRRGVPEGHERSKIPEEADIEQLNQQLKHVLEYHLDRLGPAGRGARHARWRERIAAIGSPAEPRSVRR
jgi:LysM repeat protein